MKKTFLFLCVLCVSVIAFGQLKVQPNGLFQMNNISAGNTGSSVQNNVSFGYGTLSNLLSGNYNTATGYHALRYNTTGSNNTANGYQALYTNTGSNNIANGYQALRNNNTGTNNTANGSQALFSNTTGDHNTANGTQALYSNTTGDNNTANGYQALYTNTGSNNTANGTQALYFNTTGSNNTANGYHALYNNKGSGNTANGSQALYSNTTGASNTAIGFQALTLNTTGYDNTANGYRALRSNTTGTYNIANGTNALYANMTGDYNTANGAYTLYSNTTGVSNTANGNDALYANTTGSYNVANGSFALYANTTGSFNTAVGYYANAGANNLTNTTAIGYDAQAIANNQVVIGNYTVTSVGGNVTWTTTSDGRAKKNIQSNVPGLAFINALQPVTYNLNLDAVDNLLKSDDPKVNSFRDSVRMSRSPEEQEIEAQARADKEKIVYTGFIAQDVEKTAKSIGYDFSGVDAPENGKGAYGLRYAEFVVPLVKAVQELSEQNDAKDAAIASLQEQVDRLNAKVDELTASPAQIRSAAVVIDEGEGGVANISSTMEQQATLYQNTPNPFNQSTQIRFYVPETVSNALLCIYDLQGKQLKQTVITKRGYGMETVFASEFPAGIYLYALLAEGNQVDVKRMILTE